MSEDPIDINEPKEVFFSLKANKSTGYDEINYNVIKDCFSELSICLLGLYQKGFSQML